MKKIIIIGSGMGGLIAGNLLAKLGHNVIIFESYNMPGGYTAGFYRKGYYFESGTLSFEASATVFEVMKEIGVSGKIDFVRQHMRYVSDSFEGIPESYESYKKMIYTGFPSDKAKLDLFFKKLDKTTSVMDGLDGPMPQILSGFKKFRSMLPYIIKGPAMLQLVRHFGDMTTTEFVSKYFKKGSELFKIFNNLGYPDMSAIFMGAGLSSFFTDYWTVKGGMQSWADVLAENFKKMGGILKLNSPVEKILTKDGVAEGVASKEYTYFADYVISACDYKKTLLELIDDPDLIPETFKDKIYKASVSEGFFTVYLGLDMTNEALLKHIKCPHVFVFDKNSNYDIHNSNDPQFFKKVSPSFYSPSLINPALAPEGKSSLMLQTLVPYHWMNNWGCGDKKVYMELKTDAMNALIDRAALLIPGLKECIEHKDAATPLTYEKFTHNSDGASSAWSWNPHKKFFKNTMDVHIETPVKNLFIGSCWAMQIGGIPGAIAAAYQCVNKIK